MNKKAVTYLRFSSDEQSHFSIERQQMITGTWMNHANVEPVDSFEDRGWSATNFDRPDYKKLDAFIRKNYRDIDYVVVSDLTAKAFLNSISITIFLSFIPHGDTTCIKCSGYFFVFWFNIKGSAAQEFVRRIVRHCSLAGAGDIHI